MCRRLLYLVSIILMLTAGTKVQAAVFSDDFETAHDYVADGVEGTGWDGFLGLGQQETVDALNASIDREGQLYIESSGSFWEGAFSPRGPFLYKVVEGDFIATVKVTDFPGLPDSASGRTEHNDSFLMARVPELNDAGAGEDFECVHYFPTWVGNMGRSMDDGTESEWGDTGDLFDCDQYIQLERTGNTFHFRTSPDGVNWTELVGSPVTRVDMDGLPVQVGLTHSIYSTNTGYVAFDDFSVEGALVTGLIEAYNSVPVDWAIDVSRDVVLGWTAGETAQTHDIYLGTVFDDVNDADRNNPLDVLVSQGQDANTYDSDGLLEYDQVYYWRVDEIEADGSTIHKGDIWSFTAELFAYPILAENISAAASSSEEEKEPEYIINGYGLDESGLLHDNDDENMWLSGRNGEQPTWIKFEFDKAYKLHEMWAWNYNEGLEPVVGLGFRDVTIEYSLDGTDYITLGTTHEFAQAPGDDDYEHNTTVEFNSIVAKYVRLTANSNWGGILDQYGLSEISFQYVPVNAKDPNPDSGETDIALDVTLGWKAGREAAEHNVYFSDDMQAVIDGTADVTTVTEPSYGPLSLDLGKTYYWRVDEVNDAETPNIWQGDVWNFTIHEFFVLDDFEDYNDYAPDRIFDAWIDGYGVATNGSTVGYAEPDFSAGEHFVETTIVHSGSQSMPYFFDNTTAPSSEATMTLSSLTDWTQKGIGILSLWYIGDAANAAEPMYVTLNSSATVDDDNLNAALVTEWTEWSIDLQGFSDQGIDLADVDTITIGFGDDPPGGSGLVFFDDIRLYASP